MSKLKIIFLGSRGFVIPIAQALRENFDLVAIITVPDQPSGRGYHLLPTPVKEAFLDTGINILSPEKFTEEVITQIKDLKADLFVVAAYGKIIPQSLLDIPRLGTINLHPSLLPKYRGAAPIQNAIFNGDASTGMTFMLLDKEMDHGPIIAQYEYPILEKDNFTTLGNRIFQESAILLPQIILDFESGKLVLKDQDHQKAVYVKMIKKDDGFFDLENPPSPEKLDKMIRAYYPWPTVWTKWKGKVIKLYPDEKLQIEGKKAVPLKEFLNGYPDFPLKSLK